MQPVEDRIKQIVAILQIINFTFYSPSLAIQLVAHKGIYPIVFHGRIF
jgi:hypothetical protein